jgi:hypothetical protein
MSVKVSITYDCGGCDKVETIDAGIVKRSFRSFSGRDHGFGTWMTQGPDYAAFAPEGWMAFDPYTQCCYCPACVALIFGETDEAAA